MTNVARIEDKWSFMIRQRGGFIRKGSVLAFDYAEAERKVRKLMKPTDRMIRLGLFIDKNTAERQRLQAMRAAPTLTRKAI